MRGVHTVSVDLCVLCGSRLTAHLFEDEIHCGELFTSRRQRTWIGKPASKLARDMPVEELALVGSSDRPIETSTAHQSSTQFLT